MAANLEIGAKVQLYIRMDRRFGGVIRSKDDRWLTLEDADGDRADILIDEIVAVFSGATFDRRWSEEREKPAPDVGPKPALSEDEMKAVLSAAFGGPA